MATKSRPKADPGAPEITVAAEQAGLRLDHFLKARFPELPKRQMQAWFDQGRVLCNGRAARKGSRLCEGDRILVRGPLGERGFVLVPDPELPLSVLFEDPFLVAVDKPPGMPTHPLRSGETGTLANALIVRYPELPGIGYSAREPGLLHRLDRETSGVVLAAKKAFAFEQMRVQFEKGLVLKTYLALVEGEPEPWGRIDSSIGSRGRRAGRVRAVDPADARGYRSLREAETRFRVVRRYGSFSLVRLWMRTGARHQLRVHMASIGCPIAGDRTYGSGQERLAYASSSTEPPRQLLHAAEIQFFHPESGRSMRIRSPLELEFAGYLERLRGERYR
ncbi:MAG: RluA family pseudouridine synthase [bacterium]